MNYSIGIVGNGFVGNALYENFKTKFNTKVYDALKERSNNSLSEVISCDVVFVCLPTPMNLSENCDCNLEIIDNFFVNSVPKNCQSLFVIKSTVPIGTTEKIKKLREDLKIVHNPEFLTAINAKEDFANSYRNVIGGEKEHSKVLVEIYKHMFPNAENFLVSSDESEMIKYFANTFLATKVSFFNLIYDVCQKYSSNYEDVINGICSDDRIGYSHSKVPGPDGDRGFGGTCFPKDINALINTLEKIGINNSILKEVWKYNKQVRQKYDWENYRK